MGGLPIKKNVITKKCMLYLCSIPWMKAKVCTSISSWNSIQLCFILILFWWHTGLKLWKLCQCIPPHSVRTEIIRHQCIHHAIADQARMEDIFIVLLYYCIWIIYKFIDFKLGVISKHITTCFLLYYARRKCVFFSSGNNGDLTKQLSLVSMWVY